MKELCFDLRLSILESVKGHHEFFPRAVPSPFAESIHSYVCLSSPRLNCSEAVRHSKPKVIMAVNANGYTDRRNNFLRYSGYALRWRNPDRIWDVHAIRAGPLCCY